MPEIIKLAMNCLTETQRRRLKLRLRGQKLDSIAKKEGVSIVSVYESIKLAKNKIKKQVAYLKTT